MRGEYRGSNICTARERTRMAARCGEDPHRWSPKHIGQLWACPACMTIRDDRWTRRDLTGRAAHTRACWTSRNTHTTNTLAPGPRAMGESKQPGPRFRKKYPCLIWRREQRTLAQGAGHAARSHVHRAERERERERERDVGLHVHIMPRGLGS